MNDRSNRNRAASDRSDSGYPESSSDDTGAVRRRRRSSPGDADPEDDPAPPHRRGRLALAVIALFLLGWSLLPLVSIADRQWPELIELTIVSASGTVLVVSVVAIFVATIAARQHAWESVLVATLAGLIPWIFVLPYAVSNQPDTADPGAKDAAPEENPLRVMLVNANVGQASATDITATAAANNVDVLVVTELTSVLAHELTASGLAREMTAGWIQLPGDPHVDASPEAGSGIWTRGQTPQTETITGTQWPAARLATPMDGGATMTLVVGHVDSPQHGAKKWARDLELLRKAGGEASPRLVVANLNATVWNADLRDFREAGLRDAADVLGRGPRPTWPTWSPIPLLALDHVMVSETVRVQQVQAVDIDGTDHRALVVGLMVSPDAKP